MTTQIMIILQDYYELLINFPEGDLPKFNGLTVLSAKNHQSGCAGTSCSLSEIHVLEKYAEVMETHADRPI